MASAPPQMAAKASVVTRSHVDPRIAPGQGTRRGNGVNPTRGLTLAAAGAGQLAPQESGRAQLRHAGEESATHRHAPGDLRHGLRDLQSVGLEGTQRLRRRRQRDAQLLCGVRAGAMVGQG